MSVILPADPKARRLALVIWLGAAIAGTAAVVWLSSYIDDLTMLARTDREASLALFRSRVMPALLAVVLVGVVSGAVLLRHGVLTLRAGRFPHEGARVIRDTPVRSGRPARAMGLVFAIAGFLLAAVPIVLVTLLFWLLRRT
ncbi:MAG TPA: hypothetical protein VLD67_01375 [Vicinamibacterales bacterium]|nr:hypothetical protein [Vicinamibacterales bacterium]